MVNGTSWLSRDGHTGPLSANSLTPPCIRMAPFTPPGYTRRATLPAPLRSPATPASASRQTCRTRAGASEPPHHTTGELEHFDIIKKQTTSYRYLKPIHDRRPLGHRSRCRTAGVTVGLLAYGVTGRAHATSPGRKPETSRCPVAAIATAAHNPWSGGVSTARLAGELRRQAGSRESAASAICGSPASSPGPSRHQ